MGLSLRGSMRCFNITFHLYCVCCKCSLRFLRGRLGNEDEAFEYMKNHGRWRVELGVDNLGPGDAQAKGKVKRFGRDRSGRPIVVILARRHLKKNCDLEEIRRNFIYELEGLIKDCDPVQEQLTIIFDLTQFGMKNMDYDLVKLLLDVLEYNYPEILGQSYIVSAYANVLIYDQLYYFDTIKQNLCFVVFSWMSCILN